MSKVYFKKLENLDEGVNDVVYNALKQLIKEENVKLNNTVPLKVHFGEEGNDTFIKPIYFEGVRRYLKEENINSCYIDTNVLYKGSRTLTKDHINTALNHGFTDLPVVIADGDDENMYNEVNVGLKYFESCKIGSKYKDYDNFIILSHFKGHGMAGFGGAIKQLAMGFASRGGKLHQHSGSIPLINEEKCVSCGACVRTCPVAAISIDGCAKISSDKCVGCASCSAVCPVSAITNSWKTSNFHEKLAEYAYAAQKGKINIYVQYAFNITNLCDCDGEHMEPIAKNIGVFLSTDPVAIDKATYDMFKNENNSDLFDTGLITLNYADEIGLGKLEYEIINL